jgi:hypothetical protein
MTSKTSEVNQKELTPIIQTPIIHTCRLPNDHARPKKAGEVTLATTSVAHRSGLSSRYFQVPLRVGAGLGQLDLHVIAQAGYEAQQPVGGKSIEAASEQLGNLGLSDSQQLGSFGLGKAPTLDDSQNLSGKLGFCHVFIGVFNAEVGEHIAAAVVDGNVVGHDFSPFS